MHGHCINEYISAVSCTLEDIKHEAIFRPQLINKSFLLGLSCTMASLSLSMFHKSPTKFQTFVAVSCAFVRACPRVHLSATANNKRGRNYNET